MKRFISGSLIALMLTATTPALAADTSSYTLVDNVRISYNTVTISTSQPAVLDNGRLSLALRDFFEGIHVPVDWDTDSRSATVVTADKLVVIYPDSGRITINDKEMLLDVPPQMVGQHIYVPLRFLSEQLGYEVSYNQEQGTHVVRINGTAPEMLKLHDGSVTRIKNRTLAIAEPEGAQENERYLRWKVANTGYFVDVSGKLNEIASLGQSLEVRTIDAAQAKVNTTDYSTPTPFAILGDISAAGRYAYDMQINPSASTRYLGIGTPTGTSAAMQIDTGIGRLLLYDSKAVTDFLHIDAAAGTIDGTYADPAYGFVLDTLELPTVITDGSYAISDNGYYGFLLDGYLLIVDTKQQKIIRSEMISADLEDGEIIALGNDFLISGVENGVFATHTGYYTARYRAEDGQCLQFYTNRIPQTSNSTFGYINLPDSCTTESTYYVLLKTQWDHYLGRYDTTDDTFSYTELPYGYTQFIPTPTGHALFLKDSTYFYLQPIE